MSALLENDELSPQSFLLGDSMRLRIESGRAQLWGAARAVCSALDEAAAYPDDSTRHWYAMGLVHALSHFSEANWTVLRVAWGLR